METGWTKNPSRWELEWGIRKIRGGLKNQPHWFGGGDFEKTPELYCISGFSRTRVKEMARKFTERILFVFYCFCKNLGFHIGLHALTARNHVYVVHRCDLGCTCAQADSGQCC